jgi:hypothetical protein
MQKMITILIVFCFVCLTGLFPALAKDTNTDEDFDPLAINEHCIGKVCIGDTLQEVKAKYNDHIIKVNDSQTGYYIFDPAGNFLIEFSTKKELSKKEAPIRYIMTSNPMYTFDNTDISVESVVSNLTEVYGKPQYEAGPNGYLIKFSKWPVKNTTTHDNYEINILVGIYNPGLADLFKYSGSMNEKAEVKLLTDYPENTILNTIEIYSDYYKDGKPIE